MLFSLILCPCGSALPDAELTTGDFESCPSFKKRVEDAVHGTQMFLYCYSSSGSKAHIFFEIPYIFSFPVAQDVIDDRPEG